MTRLALDYYILATLVCGGLLQVVAAYSRLHGLLLVRHVRAAYLLGTAMVAGSLAWFVAIGDASIPGDAGGIEGSEQFGLFLAGAATATVVTAALASVAQIGRKGSASGGAGLEALRDSTVLRALQRRFRKDKGMSPPIGGRADQAARR